MPSRHLRFARLARLTLSALAVLGVGLAGCGEPAPAEPSAPVPAPSSSAPASPPASSTPRQGGLSADAGTTGSDGLTVRYLDGETVRTVGVEDFPR